MQKIIYSKCSTERRNEYKIITSIWEEDGQFVVEKRAQNPEAEAYVERMAEFPQKHPYLTEGVAVVPCKKIGTGRVQFPYIEGIRLDEQISAHAKNQQWEALYQDLELLREIIINVKNKQTFVTSPFFEELFGEYSQLAGVEAVRGCSLDMVASNIILADKIYIIDYEWVFDCLIPLKFILFRSILLNGVLNTLPEEMKQRVMGLMDITEEEQAVFYQMEVHLQRYISGQTLNNIYPDMPKRNMRVNDNTIINNCYMVTAELENGYEKLYSNQFTIEESPVIKIDVKEYAQQRLMIKLADNPCIMKIISCTGIKNNSKTELPYQDNSVLKWCEDTFFAQKPCMYIDTGDFETIEIQFKVVRLTNEADNYVDVCAKGLQSEIELNEIKSSRFVKPILKLRRILRGK